jgi:hypothetical protein
MFAVYAGKVSDAMSADLLHPQIVLPLMAFVKDGALARCGEVDVVTIRVASAR